MSGTIRLLVPTLALGLAMAGCGGRATPTRRTPPALPANAADYPWLAGMGKLPPPTTSLGERFPTPGGLDRAEVAAGSFGEWLRGLPIRTDRTASRTSRGVTSTTPAAAVAAIDVTDNQRGVGTVLRLHAEWLWSRFRTADVRYHVTPAAISDWRDWVRGEHIRLQGGRVTRALGLARRAGYASYRAWIDQISTIADTSSLRADTLMLAGEQRWQPGDLIVASGDPDRVVMLLDVARDRHGRTWAVIGHGGSPAHEMSIVPGNGPEDRNGTWLMLSPPGDTAAASSTQNVPPGDARRFTTR